MRISAAAIVSLAVAGPVLAAVQDSANERSLSLDKRGPSLVFGRENWQMRMEQFRNGNQTIYFLMSHAKAPMAFSVFIDRTSACRSAESCLLKALENPKYSTRKEFQTVADSGPFKAATFFLEPPGLPVKQATLLAPAYVDGYWIDVHLSHTWHERPSMEPLLRLYRSLSIRSEQSADRGIANRDPIHSNGLRNTRPTWMLTHNDMPATGMSLWATRAFLPPKNQIRSVSLLRSPVDPSEQSTKRRIWQRHWKDRIRP